MISRMQKALPFNLTAALFLSKSILTKAGGNNEKDSIYPGADPGDRGLCRRLDHTLFRKAEAGDGQVSELQEHVLVEGLPGGGAEAGLRGSGGPADSPDPSLLPEKAQGDHPAGRGYDGPHDRIDGAVWGLHTGMLHGRHDRLLFYQHPVPCGGDDPDPQDRHRRADIKEESRGRAR